MTTQLAADRAIIDVLVLGDVLYHGTQPRTGGRGIIAIETRQGEPLGIVRHIPKHSPQGYSWGYAGSGPADAARSLMLAAIGDESICPCAGDTKQCERECDEGYIKLPYQMFKFAVLAGAPDEWRIWRSWVLQWISRAQNNITMPTTQFTEKGWPAE